MSPAADSRLTAPAPAAPPLHWGTEALWQQLEPWLPGLGIEVVRSIASTNTALLARSRAVAGIDGSASAAGAVQVRRSVESAAFGRRAADVQPCLLVAEEQTHGRGRQGRAWHSASGASLTFSLGLPLRAADWSGLSLAVGVSLCEALAGFDGSPRLGLKWPNDLWLMDAPGAGRKLGGILIETVAAGNGRLVVIGIGLNVLPLAVSGLQTGLACLRELDADATAPSTLARIALPLVRALRLFESDGFTAFAERFERLDMLRGQALRTTHPDVAEGVGRGVSAQGELIVQTAEGLCRVSSGEVSVRPIQDRTEAVTATAADAMPTPTPTGSDAPC